MSLISCENLSFAYDGVTVLSGLNFQIEQGDYLCIIGENGSGKSTLMKGLLGLKKPEKGSVTFGEGLVSTEIGYLPQQTPVQKDFPASVIEVVLSGCLSGMGFRPFYTKKERSRAAQNMEVLEITDLKDQCYRDLSGGQQQRVLLARALCATRKVILLDEPVAGLDPLVVKRMYQLIERINREMNITVIMVSHDMQAAVNYASHILHLGEDRQLFFGTVREYRHSASYHKFAAGDNAARIWRRGSDNKETRGHSASKKRKRQANAADERLAAETAAMTQKKAEAEKDAPAAAPEVAAEQKSSVTAPASDAAGEDRK